jgi:predicted SnoaL-like aldol condensation-catalyzing enzyme
MNAQSRQKQQVVALLKSFETRASEPVLAINPARYIQHNPAAEDGVEGFRKIIVEQKARGGVR